jgi:hypothetical protein
LVGELLFAPLYLYLAFKNIFRGPEAQLRTAKKIRKLIQKHMDNADGEIHALVAEHNIDNICEGPASR